MNNLITKYYKPTPIPPKSPTSPTTTFYNDDDGHLMCKCSCGRIWDGCAQCPCAIDDY